MRKNLSNTRARFQRLSDAKLFSGWVRNFGKHSILVVTPKDVECAAGEEFMFQVYGPGKVAVFRAVLESCVGNELSLRYAGDITYMPGTEEMRISTGVNERNACFFGVRVGRHRGGRFCTRCGRFMYNRGAEGVDRGTPRRFQHRTGSCKRPG